MVLIRLFSPSSLTLVFSFSTLQLRFRNGDNPFHRLNDRSDGFALVVQAPCPAIYVMTTSGQVLAGLTLSGRGNGSEHERIWHYTDEILLLGWRDPFEAALCPARFLTRAVACVPMRTLILKPRGSGSRCQVRPPGTPFDPGTTPQFLDGRLSVISLTGGFR